MNLGLDQKVALVTGASSGIGAATAQLLAEEGANVIIGYHENKAGAEQTATSVQKAGRQAWFCQMDITHMDTIEDALSILPDQARPLDVLVLCSGEAPVSAFDEITPREWQRIVDVNLNGCFNVISASHAFLNEKASIVLVASVAGQTGVPHQAHYAAAKAGLINLTKSTARALAPQVRVNCVTPGMTLTEMGRQTAESLPSDYAQTKLLLERFAEPNEIAKCIVFLASSCASFVTGATLDVNGGRYLR